MAGPPAGVSERGARHQRGQPVPRTAASSVPAFVRASSCRRRAGVRAGVRRGVRALLIAGAAAALGFLLLDRPLPLSRSSGSSGRRPVVIVGPRRTRPLRVFLSPDEKLRMPVRARRGRPSRCARPWSRPRTAGSGSASGVNPLAIGRRGARRCPERAHRVRGIDDHDAARAHGGAGTADARREDPRVLPRARSSSCAFPKADSSSLYLNAIPCGGNVEGRGRGLVRVLREDRRRISRSARPP
jgi:hypothetical protein